MKATSESAKEALLALKEYRNNRGSENYEMVHDFLVAATEELSNEQVKALPFPIGSLVSLIGHVEVRGGETITQAVIRTCGQFIVDSYGKEGQVHLIYYHEGEAKRLTVHPNALRTIPVLSYRPDGNFGEKR